MKIKYASIIETLVLLSLLFCFPSCLQAVIDLESMVQDFNLETRQIEIPGYPQAFNPSITKWRDCFLMSFRVIPDLTDLSVSRIGLLRLDENFSPVGIPQLLDTRVNNPHIPCRSEDARIFTVGDRLYVTYNDNEDEKPFGIRRIYQTEIDFDGTNFITLHTERFLNFEGEKNSTQEKNWMPFEYNGEGLFVYSLNPHRILRPLLGTSNCETYSDSKNSMQWDWGDLKGGTPALRVGDEYFGFFHSWKLVGTVEAGNRKAYHYFMGAYTFAAEPPFNITKCSPQPIISKGFYNNPTIFKRILKHVIYPGGFVIDGNYVWVVYGKADCQVWILKMDKEGLLKSLIPVYLL